MNKLSVQQMKSIKKEHGYIIDVRSKAEVSKGMIDGAINVDFDGSFASWLGTLFSPKGRFVIYSNSEENAQETIKRMLRIGYTNIDGYCISSLNEVEK